MSDFSTPIPRKALWEWLRSFWCDPSATPELASRYRARQINALARQLPLASAATCLIVIIGFFVARESAGNNAFILWSATLIAIAIGDLVAWYFLVYGRLKGSGSYRVVVSLSLMLGVAGALYAWMTVILLGSLDVSGKLILVAVVAAFISTGAWQFAILPAAGILWVFVLCVGIAAGTLMMYEWTYAFIAALLIFYWIYLTCTVLVTSQRFVFSLIAKTEIEQQRQVVGLLLRDFENNASDWLWEVDAQGCLNHVSPRMASAIGGGRERLLGLRFITILTEVLPKESAENAEAVDALVKLDYFLRQQQPFTLAHVATQSQSEVTWWSLTAQPLLGANGQLEGWRGVGSDITAARLREREMVYLANTDTLTKLGNRHLFVNTLHGCFSGDVAVGNSATLITLDLDNFKTVNDMLGHLAGDELLKEVARRLQSITPFGSLLARLGGDEFAWIVPAGLTPLQSEAFGRDVRRVLAEPWLHQEHTFDVGASIGVANAPLDGVSPIALQRASDMALYSAKAGGRNKLCFFDKKLDEYAMRRLALLNDLRQGLASQEFFVLYQPQIRFCDGALIGFEALVRWRHPLRGLVSPVEFIPLTEENGLIVPLGEWVLNRACSDAMTWPAQLRVAVNVSSVQIERSNLLETVLSSLRLSGLRDNRLEIELTESSLMRDGEVAISLLNRLRGIGVRIALDDFGTGYSSLSYLQRFPIDKLKIDRSFVLAASAQEQDISKSKGAQSILRAILHLAQALGLETIAEGVETEEMAGMLSALGFENAQGYLYGQPMTAQQAQEFIEKWPVIINSDFIG